MFGAGIVFLSPTCTCLQEFFSTLHEYDLQFLHTNACKIYFSQVSLAGIFLGKSHPTSGYFQWSILKNYVICCCASSVWFSSSERVILIDRLETV